MMQTQTLPLKDLFNDADYAWQLLEGEVNLQVADTATTHDVTNLLELYMKGVQKMNSYLDFREAFFKKRVISLMSRPSVMKTLSNKQPMSKKNIAPIANTHKQQAVLDTEHSKEQEKNSSSKKLQLKQKKMQIEVRLAYEVEQNTPDVLHNMIIQQDQKETSISSKINKIVENHEEQLNRRIKERKLKNTSKSLSNILINNNSTGEPSKEWLANGDQRSKSKEQAIQSCIELDRQQREKHQRQRTRRQVRSCQPRKCARMGEENQSPLKKSVSFNIALQARRVGEHAHTFNDF